MNLFSRLLLKNPPLTLSAPASGVTSKMGGGGHLALRWHLTRDPQSDAGLLGAGLP